MKSAILALIAEHQHVTFAQLVDEIPGFTGGLHYLCHGGDENLILWEHLTESAFLALIALQKENAIHLHPSTPLAYTALGYRPRMRAARHGRRYKSPRWLPVCFCTYPFRPQQADQ